MLIEITMVALKAIGGARTVARLTGHDVPTLDDIAQAARAARAHHKVQQLNDAASGAVPASSAPAADSSPDGTDLGSFEGPDAPDGIDVSAGIDIGDLPGAGLISDIVEWFKDSF
jgi:hypothetical protein